MEISQSIPLNLLIYGDNAYVFRGHVGSAVYAEAGCDSNIGGGIYSGGNIFLRERDTIQGDAIAGDSVKKQNSVRIEQTERNNALVDLPQIPVNTVTYGTVDITVGNDQIYELTPGDYRDFHAYSRSVISIRPGKYSFKSFYLEPDINLILKVSQVQEIEFNVADEVRFGNNDTMIFESGIIYPFSFRVYSTQTKQLVIGTESIIYGMYTAPFGEIHVYSRTKLLFKKINIKRGNAPHPNTPQKNRFRLP